MTSRRCSALLMLVALALLTTGCLTAVRRSAFVPRNTAPSRVGGPLKDGQVHLSAQVNSVDLEGLLFPDELESAADLFNLIPGEQAPGLFIPSFHLGATGYFALNDIVEIGAQFHVTRLEWADPNYLGVLPFPRDEVDWLWMAGPGVRINVPLGELPVTLAGIVEANFTRVPQATYICEECADGLQLGEMPVYRFDRIDRESFVLPQIAAHVSYSPHEIVHVWFFLSGARNVKNLGFDSDITNADESTLEGYFFGQVGLGTELRIAPLSINLGLMLPFAQPAGVPSDLSGLLQLGVVF